MKAVDKTQAGTFIDLKELLCDNIALHLRLSETNPAGVSHQLVTSKMREITDPLAWVYCYLSFMAVKLQSPEARNLIAYGQIVLHLARKHGGRGWVAYDNLFRQQMAAGAPLSMAEINPSLMAATVLGPGNEGANKLCVLCMGSDHIRADCALAPLEAKCPPHQATPQPTCPLISAGRPKPYSRADLCRRYNKNLPCFTTPCRYDHLCSSCSAAGHSALDCTQRFGKPVHGPPK